MAFGEIHRTHRNVKKHLNSDHLTSTSFVDWSWKPDWGNEGRRKDRHTDRKAGVQWVMLF